ncbi:lysozyme [Streptomyces olivochromogenes]|uniref:lysozyme n=1 Tax=Streptomyces olivochromogenes TaxID=1963 RepID=UPI0035B1687E|nr:lysozyme [Streptomyces olivochromogenes]
MGCVRPYIAERARRAYLIATALPVAASLLALVSAVPASADVPPTPVRGSAYMGIGVVAHDGQDGTPSSPKAGQTEGVDVASYQGKVAWSTLWSSGVKWSYSKASEGTYYTNPYFSSQSSGARDVGMIRGAYHFATPDTTGGAKQADYFVDHGGGWRDDGSTLPGVLDIEWNPYGDDCYGKSASSMVSWVRDFLNRYKSRTGRDAVIYTSTSWWNSCTGGYSGFGSTNPLWVAKYASTVGSLPPGWSTYTMWQYTSTGPTVGDHDRFNGSTDRLKALANG